MSQNDPEVLRADIARTRAELSDNVDTLTDTANPKNIADRQVEQGEGRRPRRPGAPDGRPRRPVRRRHARRPRRRGQGHGSGLGRQDRASGAVDTVADAPAAGAAQGPRATRWPPG